MAGRRKINPKKKKNTVTKKKRAISRKRSVAKRAVSCHPFTSFGMTSTPEAKVEILPLPLPLPLPLRYAQGQGQGQGQNDKIGGFEGLPQGYGEDRICLMVRDPWWLYTYWEVTQNKWEALKQELGSNFYTAKKLLRVYNISNIIFNGSNAHSFFDIEVGIDTDNWYINTAGPGKSWCVDLGLRLIDGRFITIIRSNIVSTPIDGPSWITDEEWVIPEEMFRRLYSMGFGFGRTSPGKAWAESMRRALFSGALSSPGSKAKLHKMSITQNV